MNNIRSFVTGHTGLIVAIFAVLSIVSGVLSLGVKVNIDNTKYLPPDTNSKQAAEKLLHEFDINGNVSLLVKDKSIFEVSSMKEEILKIDGVGDVIWLDDYTGINIPEEFIDIEYINRFYKNNTALLSIMLTNGNDHKISHDAIGKIQNIAGEKGFISGPAAVSESIVERTGREIPAYMTVAVILILIILFSTTRSWIEPLLFLVSIGAAILINMGSNIFKGEISQTTFAAASLLQLAVSMDYSIFLLHRFHEEREKGVEVKQAMINSMKLSYPSIVASAVTTIAGFTALIFMNFGVGKDMGLVLAKGIVLSLISVLTLLPSLVILFHRWIEKYTHKVLKLEFKKISKLSLRFRHIIVLAVVLIAALFFAAQLKVDYYYGSENMLPGDDRVIMSINEKEGIYGASNQNILLVPKGDKVKEAQMLKDIESLPFTAGISGIYSSLGTEIPEMMIPANLVEEIQSDNYSMITFDIKYDRESSRSFEAAADIRSLVDKYYDDWYIAGETFSYKDLKDITDSDFLRTNILSALFIFLILLVTFKSLTIPLIAVFVIELGIWINMGIIYFTDEPVSFLSSIIIGAIQLGATVDYAILYISRYRENLQHAGPVRAAQKTLQDTGKSILTSGSILVAATFTVAIMASIKTASEMCLLIGRGALISMFCVMFVLPGFLILADKVIRKTSVRWPAVNKFNLRSE